MGPRFVSSHLHWIPSQGSVELDEDDELDDGWGCEDDELEDDDVDELEEDIDSEDELLEELEFEEEELVDGNGLDMYKSFLEGNEKTVCSVPSQRCRHKKSSPPAGAINSAKLSGF